MLDQLSHFCQLRDCYVYPKFFPQGFEGQIALEDGEEGATLSVNILPLDAAEAGVRPQSYEEAAPPFAFCLLSASVCAQFFCCRMIEG